MYGVESASSGSVGGLAAQAPPDVYFPQALAIANQASAVAGGGPPLGGTALPINASGEVQTPTAFSGMAAPATPVSQQHPHWSSVLDFHGSPAPWILLGILVLYGWIHVSARARVGPAKAAAVL